MVIQEVLQQLESASQPVTKILHKGDLFKVIVIGFKKGMVLKEHKTTVPAKLTVVEGKVVYREGDQTIVLQKWATKDIPVNVLHAVEGVEDSLCLLTVG